MIWFSSPGKFRTTFAEREPWNPEARYYHGVTLAYRGLLSEAVHEFEAAIQADRTFTMAYYAAYLSLWEAGEYERGLGYLERWTRDHPTDMQARQLYENQRRLLGGPESAPILPRPPVPSLP